MGHTLDTTNTNLLGMLQGDGGIVKQLLNISYEQKETVLQGKGF